MDIARQIVYILCIAFGMAAGQLWHAHTGPVIVAGIIWFAFIFAFFFFVNYRESKGIYAGRHRGE